MSGNLGQLAREARKLTECRHHGWAAARADLSNPENRKQFDDVYQRLADFFSKVDRA